MPVDPEVTLLSDDPPESPNGLFAVLSRRAAKLKANADEVKKVGGWQAINLVVAWLTIVVMLVVWATGGLWGTLLLGGVLATWTVHKCLYYNKVCADFAYMTNDLVTRRDRQAFIQLVLHLLSARIVGMRDVEMLHRPETPDMVWFRFTIGAEDKPGIQAEASCRFVQYQPIPSMVPRRVVDEVVVYIRNQPWSQSKISGIARWICPN